MPTIRSRGKLPHWEAEPAIYFVTFRLADSLPRSVLQEFEAERQNILTAAKQVGRAALSPSDEKRLEELLSEKIQGKLDAGTGKSFLRDPQIAGVVSEALRHFNLMKYRMYAWCVMPNHVHALFRILDGHALAEILHAWKSFSATKANSAVKTFRSILVARVLPSSRAERRRVLSNRQLHCGKSESSGLAQLALGRR
ncbi:MAG TPA: transposase [Candidatus Acidoferrum sp.]|jgi:REP element-mobilizing transposase RayT